MPAAGGLRSGWVKRVKTSDKHAVGFLNEEMIFEEVLKMGIKNHAEKTRR